MDWRRDNALGRCVTDDVGMTTGTPAAATQWLKLGVTGQPRSSAVKVPAYLHRTARPGATPNTKVRLPYTHTDPLVAVLPGVPRSPDVDVDVDGVYERRPRHLCPSHLITLRFNYMLRFFM